MYGQPFYYPNPTVQSAQQRLQMMENQYPQFAGSPIGYPQAGVYQNNSQPATVTASVLKGRPVSNEEEANAAMIDFDGSLFVFPDKAHGKIYTKQLGLDGNIIFLKYSLDTGNSDNSSAPQSLQVTPQDMTEYVKKTDLDQQIAGLSQKIALLEQRFQNPQNNGKGGFNT